MYARHQICQTKVIFALHSVSYEKIATDACNLIYEEKRGFVVFVCLVNLGTTSLKPTKTKPPNEWAPLRREHISSFRLLVRCWRKIIFQENLLNHFWRTSPYLFSQIDDYFQKTHFEWNARWHCARQKLGRKSFIHLDFKNQKFQLCHSQKNFHEKLFFFD